LSYSEKGREADIHLVSELFPKFNEITSLDVNSPKIFGFIGGSTMREGRTNHNNVTKNGVVSAFTFNKNLKIIANLVLPEDKCSSVGCILTSPEYEELIYVATDGPLFILGLNVAGRKLQIVKAINYHNQGKLFLD